MKNNPSLYWDREDENNFRKKEKKSKTLIILRGSLKILKNNKKLLWLSIIPTFIIGVLLLGIFIFLLVYYLKQGEFIKNTLFYISFFLSLILSFFIYFYFRAALIYCIYQSLRNEKISFKEAFNVAKNNSIKIIRWTFIDSALGISMVGFTGKETGYATALPIMAARATWNLLTIFVIPILIIENLSVKNAIIRSSQLFTKVWIKATVFEFSVGWIFIIIALTGVFVIPFVLVNLSITILPFLSNHIEIVIAIAYGLFMSTILILGIIVATLREIFIIVLYNYAKTGRVPQNYFNKETIKEAFK